MSNGSPTAYLSWSVLASLFLAFFIYHLWSYDRFQCLRWNAGRQPGAFKRVMTYTYFMSVPLLVVFGVGITVLKFQEGFVPIPGEGDIIPKPASLWSPSHRHMLLVLYFVFSVAWASEQVTHFEELAFWLFLLDQGPEKREWFSSWEYRLWVTSCIVAILGMPLTTLISRHEMDTIDAWIFLVGSLSSTVTNVIFLSVLFRFPAFLRHVKAEGADPDVVVRLSTFYELNLVRIVFRFTATLPLLILAADGVRGTHPINRKQFWIDFFLMISAIGQFISSSITLMVFFPRSVTREAGYRHRAASSGSGSLPLPRISPKFPVPTSPPFFLSSQPVTPTQLHTARSSEVDMFSEEAYPGEDEPVPDYDHIPDEHELARTPNQDAYVYQYERDPHRLVRRETVPAGGTSAAAVPSRIPIPTARFLSTSALHPYVTSYTSPIDLIELPQESIPPRSA